MSSKTYYIYQGKSLYNNMRYFLKKKITIKCVGGENMPEEKPKMVFLEPEDIPSMNRGKKGKDWENIFNQIPKGKAWKVPSEFASGATIRDNVKKINAVLKTKEYTVSQRTGKDEQTELYVIRAK